MNTYWITLVNNLYTYILPVLIVILLLLIIWFFFDIHRVKKIFFKQLANDANEVLEDFKKTNLLANKEVKKQLNIFIDKYSKLSSNYSILSKRLEELENHNRTLSEIISRKNKQLDKLKRNRN